MNHLIISSSLSADSRSALMGEYLHGALAAQGALGARRALRVDVETVDLRTFELPICDGGPAFGDANVKTLSEKIANADSITLAVSIYNYDVGAAARNLIAVAGSAWTDRVVGFIGAAGGDRAYMAIMGLANSLMLDFRSVIVPRFVYASRAAFPGGRPNGEIAGRLDALAADLHRFASAFNAPDMAQS